MSTNQYICQIHNSEKFLTAFLGILDAQTGALDYVSAGHDHPLLITDSKVETRLEPTGPAIGIMEDAEFSAKSVKLSRGTTLLLYSDGVTDVRSEDEEIFGPAKFQKLINGGKSSAGFLVEHIVAEIEAFRGEAKQFDDMTLLAIGRVKP